ncbi:hypothetical protein ABB37_02265 [Leptomonas pyrrhocoris]|uniref:Transmembrane protein n=1 Tax=Leptomonas pyrrhocoris TaxID=157538 RepID=A0A0N0DYK9_LEPPY|nr:hypothetical protein ABB37_02265 [Leptomonas pyrrhocoris]KPA84211.1 hypothetical protein ABB37_02265 [Leptomonas pyrrhocoris]|eukprot:XP_015662650.1 hypothetical protein ABB37_02265 [Leptomonas pyrrhocoris]
MDQAAVSEWSVVGTFRKRPVPQGPIIDLTSDLSKHTSLNNEDDTPVLLYEAKTDENQQPSRVPRYLARKVAIPPPSFQKLKVVSLALPRPTDNVAVGENLPNVDCAEPITTLSCHRDGVRRKYPYAVGTVLPAPPQLAFILPVAIFLADIALLVVSLTTHKPRNGLIAACCLLVLVPDIGALVLLLKRGIYSTTFAIHLLLWPNIVLLFIQPFVSLLFMIHFILTAIMVMYCLRVRASTYTTFFTLR